MLVSQESFEPRCRYYEGQGEPFNEGSYLVHMPSDQDLSSQQTHYGKPKTNYYVYNNTTGTYTRIKFRTASATFCLALLSFITRPVGRNHRQVTQAQVLSIHLLVYCFRLERNATCENRLGNLNATTIAHMNQCGTASST